MGPEIRQHELLILVHFTLTDAQLINANPTDQQNTAATANDFQQAGLFSVGSNTANAGGSAVAATLTLAEFGDLADLTPTQLAAFNAGDLTTIGA